MEMCETMTVYTLVVFVLVILMTATGQSNHATSQTLRNVSSTSALKFLTKEMSDMDNFKSSILLPMLVERVSGTESNKAVQQHIKSFLKHWYIVEDTFTDTTPYGTKEFTNIIATFDNSKPIKIILACHFDSKYMPNQKFVAATDSAVPCSILLETARQLQCLLEKGAAYGSLAHDLTLQLVFLDGEEAFKTWTSTDSLYGARHLASRWAEERDPVNNNITKLQAIRYFVLLDLIGTTDTSIFQQYTRTSELYQYLLTKEQMLRDNNYLVGGYPGPIFRGRRDWPSPIEDDHVPFVERGVAALHLISNPFPSVWHQPADDFEHLDFNLIDDFCRIFRVFISDLMHLRPESRGCRKK